MFMDLKTGTQGIHPGFGFQGRRHQKSKTGVSAAPQKDLYPPKIEKKTGHMTRHPDNVQEGSGCSNTNIERTI